MAGFPRVQFQGSNYLFQGASEQAAAERKQEQQRQLNAQQADYYTQMGKQLGQQGYLTADDVDKLNTGSLGTKSAIVGKGQMLADQAQKFLTMQANQGNLTPTDAMQQQMQAQGFNYSPRTAAAPQPMGTPSISQPVDLGGGVRGVWAHNGMPGTAPQFHIIGAPTGINGVLNSAPAQTGAPAVPGQQTGTGTPAAQSGNNPQYAAQVQAWLQANPNDPRAGAWKAYLQGGQ